MNRNIVILMTACVNPSGMSFTALQDVETRKRQYLEAIDYYLWESKYDVVFVENTGTDISQGIATPPNKKFEYLTFQANDYNKELGKGYGEAQIIRYAMQHSQLIKDTRYVIKITGRIKVLNIKTLVCWWCGFTGRRIVQIELFGGNVYSVCFISTKEWLDQTIKKYDNMLNDTQGVFFEHIIYRSLMESQQIDILPCFPRLEGDSGTSGKPYKQAAMTIRKVDCYSGLASLYLHRHNYVKHAMANALLHYYVLKNKIQKTFLCDCQ